MKRCCKQCRHVKFKGTMTKWHILKYSNLDISNLNYYAVYMKTFHFFQLMSKMFTLTDDSDEDLDKSLNQQNYLYEELYKQKVRSVSGTHNY